MQFVSGLGIFLPQIPVPFTCVFKECTVVPLDGVAVWGLSRAPSRWCGYRRRPMDGGRVCRCDSHFSALEVPSRSCVLLQLSRLHLKSGMCRDYGPLSSSLELWRTAADGHHTFHHTSFRMEACHFSVRCINGPSTVVS